MGEKNSSKRKTECLDGTRDLVFVLDALPEGLLMASPSGTIRHCNPAASRILGCDAGSVVGKRWEELGLEGHWQGDGVPGPVFSWSDLAAAPMVSQQRFVFRSTCQAGRLIEVRVNRLSPGGSGHLQGFLMLLRDITEERAMQEKIRVRIELDQLMASMASRFVNAPFEGLDQAIQESVATIGEFFRVDRCYIFELSRDRTSMDNTFEWCASGVSAQRQRLQGLTAQDLPWFIPRMLSGETVVVPSVADLPAAASLEREEFLREGIVSLITVPFRMGGEVAGFIGFDSLQSRDWLREDVQILIFAAEIVAAAFQRRRAERALRESENLYRSLFEMARDAILVTDARTGLILDANRRAEELTGLSRDHLLGRSQTSLYTGTGREKALEVFHSVVSRAMGAPVEAELIGRDGAAVPVEFTAGAIRLSDGRQLIQGIFRDASERIRTEEALRASEQKLRRIFDSLPIGITFRVLPSIPADLRQVTSKMEINPFIPQWLGYSPEELMELGVKGITHPEDFPREAVFLMDLLAGRRSGYKIEKRYVRKDGRTLWAEVQSQALPDQPGPSVSVICTMVDITSRKEAETALEERQRFIQNVVDMTPNVVYLYGLSERKLDYLNSRAADLIGFPVDVVARFIPEDWRRLLHPEDEVSAQAAFRGMDDLGPRECREIEFRVRHADGRWCHVQTRNVVFSRDSTGKARQILGIAEDVSPARLVQDELRRAKEAAESASMAKTQFMAMVSHELRTPLTVILGYGDLLTRVGGDSPPLPLPLAEIASQILNSGNHLRNLIDGILDFARIDAGKFRIEPRRFDLAEEMGFVLTYGQSLASAKKVEFRARGFQPGVWLTTDPQILRQVLMNLVGNAFKFTSNGWVELAVETKATGVHLRVRDTGVGISRKDLERVFEPFFQASAGHRRRFGGVGLGLAITKRIVDELAGEIRVESEERVGTTVEVFLPGVLDP